MGFRGILYIIQNGAYKILYKIEHGEYSNII